MPRLGMMAWSDSNLTEMESKDGDARGEFTCDHSTGRLEVRPGDTGVSNLSFADTVKENVGKDTRIC